MKIFTHKSIFYQLVILLFVQCFLSYDIHADIALKYQNKKNISEFLHVFIKNDSIKIVSTQNTTKIVNLQEGTLLLFENQKDHYTKIPVKAEVFENKRKKTTKSKKELFSAKIVKTKKRKKIIGISANEFSYTSNIDPRVKIHAIKGNSADIDNLLNALRIVHRHGNELLKEPAYYYSLKEGYIPLSLSSKEFEWEAVQFSREVSADVFKLPENMKERDYRLILKDAVDGITGELESEISIQ